MAKRKGGRPPKLTNNFIEAAKEVLFPEDGSHPAIIHTDKDLIFLINEKLEEDERICDSTFKKWKAGESQSDILDQFLPLIQKALIEQRKNLFESLKSEKNGWQRWAWIIERKFDDWNIVHKNKSNVQQETTIVWEEEKTYDETDQETD